MHTKNIYNTLYIAGANNGRVTDLYAHYTMFPTLWNTVPCRTAIQVIQASYATYPCIGDCAKTTDITLPCASLGLHVVPYTAPNFSNVGNNMYTDFQFGLICDLVTSSRYTQSEC